MREKKKISPRKTINIVGKICPLIGIELTYLPNMSPPPHSPVLTALPKEYKGHDRTMR